jgi:ABC-type transporter Mla MlaB component
VPCVVVLMDGHAEVARWPLPEARHADLSVVDHLARLQLAARRRGLEIRVRDAPARLTELMDLVGLSGIMTGIDRP